MKILIVTDKDGSAIDRLCQPIKTLLPHLDIKIHSLHPKRPDLDQLENVPKYWDEADLIMVAYWKSGEKFRELHPEKFRAKRKILCHYNPYNIHERNWQEDYKAIVVGNQSIHSEIPFAHLIPYCIDLDFWKFQREYPKNSKIVNMVAARIEGKKGIREVAKACKELGYTFKLAGRISKMGYFKEIMAENPDTIFMENITDEEIRSLYHESAIHVCNSIDNFESGTLPILEAMATGCPVLTRNVGHVPDLYGSGRNLVMRTGKSDDYDDLKKHLKELMENSVLRTDIREKAWGEVKNRQIQKMALRFESLFYKLMSENQPLVSIIMPTKDKPDVLIKSLAMAVEQDWKHKEIIVVDSGNIKIEVVINAFRKKTNVPIKYLCFSNHGQYTLAKARNYGAIAATGDYLVFCDERVGMKPNALTEFMQKRMPRNWMFGVKDGVEKGFVENFSCVRRSEFMDFGMMNERVNCYGGASQEIRDRFGKQEFMFERVATAQAIMLSGSKNKYTKKADISRAKLLLWRMYGDK